MKIAIPTKGNQVDDHFGHCEFYTIFTTDENQQIINTEILPSPQGCGCKSNIASTLKEKGVTILLSGNMGEGALNVLRNHQIEVFRGNKGDIRELAENFLQGNITDSGRGCHQHELHYVENSDHRCGHHK